MEGVEDGKEMLAFLAVHPVRIVVVQTSEKSFVQMYRKLLSELDDHSGLTVKLSTYGMDRSNQARIRTEKKVHLG